MTFSHLISMPKVVDGCFPQELECELRVSQGRGYVLHRVCILTEVKFQPGKFSTQIAKPWSDAHSADLAERAESFL